MPPFIIKISDTFTRFPGGRFRTDGPGNGQAFREDILVPALKANAQVVVDLDGVAGFPASFLEEAFGGLVREHGYSSDELDAKLIFRADTTRMRSYPEMIRRYIERAKSALAAA